MAAKQAVLDYLQHDRTLRGGRDLYNKMPQKNLSIQNYIARFSDTESNLKVICYELCKLVGIPERQMNILLNKPLVKKEIEVIEDKTDETSLDDMLLNFDAENNKDLNKLKTLLNTRE